MDIIAVYPKCGLYKTTDPVPGHESQVPAGRLVYFHNHSEKGPPVILVPAANRHNRWTFHDHGHLVTDVGYLNTLKSMRAEGFYRLREHFHLADGQVVSKNALAQLGYNAVAEPILFFPQPLSDDNGLRFPDKGFKIDERVYKLLEPLDVRGAHSNTPHHLH